MSDNGDLVPAWQRRVNRFKSVLAEGRPAVAMWLTTSWTGAIDVLGAADADAAFIDLEHVSYGIAEAERLIIACEAAGVSPLVRPASLDGHDVSRILDAGAHGIIFPQIEDADQAAAAVGCLRYAPRGTRGWGGAHTRSAVWQGSYAADFFAGRTASAGVYSAAYVAKAEADALCILLVETARGVENIEAIAAVDGVDAVVFGWGDYSVEAGFDAQRCREAAAAVYEACRHTGVGVALSAGDAFYPGCFVIAGVDSMHMSGALTGAVAQARQGCEAAALA